jgi:hypothetical protein
MKPLMLLACLLLGGCAIPGVTRPTAEDVSKDIDRVSSLGRPTFDDPRNRMQYKHVVPGDAAASADGSGPKPGG